MTLKIRLALLILPFLLISCSSSVKVDKVIRGFFEEVNHSNFETAKAKYLSALTINGLNSPLTRGEHVNANPQKFGYLAGSIESVEVTNPQVKGESATASATLVTNWGGRYVGRVDLIKEGGREWKISDLSKFDRVGEERANRGTNGCYPNNADAANSDFQAAAAENPQDSSLVTAWAGCYLKLGNLAAAEEKAKKAIEMHPDSVWSAYYVLSEVYSRKGKVPEAEAALEKAIKNKPDNAFPYIGLADLYADKGIKLDRAIELSHKALSLAPDNGYALDAVGWAYYKKGDREQAARYLSRAVAKEPSNQDIRSHYKEALKH
jgi:tetratricopeptide (TPR) repeat protein